VVTKHALCCIQAHHENKVKTILKHFPGHGSSTGDTHKGIVDVETTWQFSELIPYANILQSGKCDAIMTAHLVNARWDSTRLPATLSRPVITGMLRGLLNYNGVIFSDDMQMHAISKNYGFETAIGLAINAGVDVLIFGNNVDPGEKPITATEIHTIIKKLVTEKIISEKRIDESYRRIVQLKNKS
jgi:beta-N-acetylhexosaminidase